MPYDMTTSPFRTYYAYVGPFAHENPPSIWPLAVASKNKVPHILLTAALYGDPHLALQIPSGALLSSEFSNEHQTSMNLDDASTRLIGTYIPNAARLDAAPIQLLHHEGTPLFSGPILNQQVVFAMKSFSGRGLPPLNDTTEAPNNLVKPIWVALPDAMKSIGRVRKALHRRIFDTSPTTFVMKLDSAVTPYVLSQATVYLLERTARMLGVTSKNDKPLVSDAHLADARRHYRAMITKPIEQLPLRPFLNGGKNHAVQNTAFTF